MVTGLSALRVGNSTRIIIGPVLGILAQPGCWIRGVYGSTFFFLPGDLCIEAVVSSDRLIIFIQAASVLLFTTCQLRFYD